MDVPTIANVLMRTTLLGSSSTQAANARNADLCLNPPVASAGLMEFQALDKLAETGYRYALEELQTWWSARAGG
jgi:predicted acylesterase/phospholipase RssA